MIESFQEFDARVLEALYAARDPSLVQAFIWVSELGRAWTVYGIGGTLVLFLILKRHAAYAAGLGISLAASGLGILLIKGLVERARPPRALQAYIEIWYSFPSAHAALSAALYGFIAYIAWKSIPNPVVRYIAISIIAGIVLIISFSRLYLGVHYASDVLAGLALGAACAWLGARYAVFAARRP